MIEYDIGELNQILKKSETSFDSKGGYEILLAQIAKNLPLIYGENTAKNFTYQLGAAPGKEVAKKILASRGNKKYDNPVKALINLLQRLPKYYRAELVSVERNDKDNLVIALKLNSYLDPVFNKNKDVKRGGILCQINKGYITSALELLTGMKVSYNHGDSPADYCEISIEFK